MAAMAAMATTAKMMLTNQRKQGINSSDGTASRNLPSAATVSKVGRAKIAATAGRDSSDRRNDSDGNGGAVSNGGNGSSSDESRDCGYSSNGSNGKDRSNGSKGRQ